MRSPQRDERVNVSINGRAATIDQGYTGNDILKEIGEVPENRTLVLHREDGTYQQIPKDRRIMPRNGDRFSTILNQIGG